MIPVCGFCDEHAKHNSLRHVSICCGDVTLGRCVINNSQKRGIKRLSEMRIESLLRISKDVLLMKLRDGDSDQLNYFVTARFSLEPLHHRHYTSCTIQLLQTALCESTERSSSSETETNPSMHFHDGIVCAIATSKRAALLLNLRDSIPGVSSTWKSLSSFMTFKIKRRSNKVPFDESAEVSIGEKTVDIFFEEHLPTTSSKDITRFEQAGHLFQSCFILSTNDTHQNKAIVFYTNTNQLFVVHLFKEENNFIVVGSNWISTFVSQLNKFILKLKMFT